MLFLDTCIVADLLRRESDHYLQRLREAEAADRQVAISSLVLHELSHGAMISGQPALQLDLLDAFIARTQVEPWTAEDAIAAARVRADVGSAGGSIDTVDSLIAGQALNRGWAVVTAHLKEFACVWDLSLVDWSDPAGAREINQATRTEWMLANIARLSKEAK